MKENRKHILRRKRYWVLVMLIACLLTAYFCRRPMLRGAYGFLNIGETPTAVYDYALILGGEPLDRPAAAADLYRAGKVKRLICTGAQVPRPLAAIGMQMTEAEATKKRLLALGVPEEAILVLPEATSTREEADALNRHFKDQRRSRLLLITTETHTRRALGVFKEYAEPWDEMAVYGVAPSQYDAHWWWKNEYGFLAVFEEYLKLVYYWFAY